MALENCPDCEQKISNKAFSCIHCGFQKQRSVFTRDLGFDGQVFQVVITLGIIGFVIGGFVAGISNFLVGFGMIGIGFLLMFAGTLLLLIRSIR